MFLPVWESRVTPSSLVGEGTPSVREPCTLSTCAVGLTCMPCLPAGEPPAPTGVTLSNVGSGQAYSAAVTLDLPTPDVALGYVLSLKYFPPTPANAAPVDVTDGSGSADIAVPRSSPQLSVVGGKLVLNLDLPNLQCSTTGAACGDGKYELAAFAAASYWDNADPQAALDADDISDGTWRTSAKSANATLPTGAGTIFFVGEGKGAAPARQALTCSSINAAAILFEPSPAGCPLLQATPTSRPSQAPPP